MSETCQAVEGGLDTEDKRRQSIVSTAQPTKIRPSSNVNAEDPFETLYRSLPTLDIEMV